MSDEQQVTVRNVRLCQCGKAAGHITVCNRAHDDTDREVERIDRKAEERFARDRQEHDHGRRLRLNMRERERRRNLKGLDLALEVMHDAVRMSTVKAGNPEPSRGNGDAPDPPRQQQVRDDPRWKLAEQIVHRGALTLAELVDEARGRGQSAAVSALDTDAKNKVILEEGEGMSAEDAFFHLGPGYGSPSVIRKLRRDQGLDTRGYPKEMV